MESRLLALCFTLALSAPAVAGQARAPDLASGFELDRHFPPAARFSFDAGGLADELRLKALPLRWRQLAGGPEQVVYLGEERPYGMSRRYLSAVLDEIAGAGITHLGLELPSSRQPMLDGFCGSGKAADPFPVSAPHAEDTVALFRAACAAGLKLVALDGDEPAPARSEEEETAFAERIAAVIANVPRARMLVLLSRSSLAGAAQPAALERAGFFSRSYVLLTNGVEESSGRSLLSAYRGPRVTEPADRRFYLALEAAGLKNSPLILPCPSSIRADRCLAVPAILAETAKTDFLW